VTPEQTRLWKKVFNSSPLGPIRITRRHSHHQPMDKSAAFVIGLERFERGFGARGRFRMADLCERFRVRGPGGDSTGLATFIATRLSVCSKDSLHRQRFGLLGLVDSARNAVARWTGLCGTDCAF